MFARGLDDRVAVVTGAARGIGFSTATRLRAEGARLVGIDVDTDALCDGMRSIDQHLDDGKASVALPCDLSKPDAVSDVLDSVVERWGRVDVLVNVAGVTSTADGVEGTSVEEWHRVMNINLTGAFLMIRGVLPHMRRTGWGRIVNVASTAAVRPSSTMPAYAASKGGLVALTQELALELVGTAITVNAIAPGAVETSLPKPDGELRRRLRPSYIPLQRAASADEIASAIAFLASNDASYVTGHVLIVDGGATAVTMLPRATYVDRS